MSHVICEAGHVEGVPARRLHKLVLVVFTDWLEAQTANGSSQVIRLRIELLRPVVGDHLHVAVRVTLNLRVEAPHVPVALDDDLLLILSMEGNKLEHHPKDEHQSRVVLLGAETVLRDKHEVERHMKHVGHLGDHVHQVVVPGELKNLEYPQGAQQRDGLVVKNHVDVGQEHQTDEVDLDVHPSPVVVLLLPRMEH